MCLSTHMNNKTKVYVIYKCACKILETRNSTEYELPSCLYWTPYLWRARVIHSASVLVHLKGPFLSRHIKNETAALYLQLLITVKHWGRETEGISDRRSALWASNYVHTGFILALIGPLLLDSTSLLSPPHQLDSFYLRIHLMSSSSVCPLISPAPPPPLLYSSFKAISSSCISKLFQWLFEDRRKHTYEDIRGPCLLNILLLTHRYCDLPHIEIRCSPIDVWGR